MDTVLSNTVLVVTVDTTKGYGLILVVVSGDEVIVEKLAVVTMLLFDRDAMETCQLSLSL